MNILGKLHGAEQLIIFTDLDGSLLNHSDYSWSSAMQALERIRKNSIPLVFCTSKNLSEVEQIQKEMGIFHPFIVENGGGIFFPKTFGNIPHNDKVYLHGYNCIQLGVSYNMIRFFIRQLQKNLKIRGFGDMTEDEVVQGTGLSLEKVALAKKRDFTEPFVIGHTKDLASLEKAATAMKLRITKGGRFYHLMGYRNNKGLAVGILKDIYSKKWRSSIVAIGIGDSINDIPMFEHVDIPVLIPHEDNLYKNIYPPNIIKALYSGSKGWNQAVNLIMDEMDLKAE